MKKKLVLMISIVILILVATLVSSVAFFSGLINGEKVISVKTGDLTFKYTEVTGIGNGINLIDTEPISDNEGKKLDNYFDFKVDGKLTRSGIKYDINLELLENSTTNLEGVKVYLTELVDGEEKDIESNFDINGKVKTLSDYQNLVIYEETVPRNTKNYEKKFRLRVWIDENTDIYSDGYIGTSIGFKVNVNAKTDINDVAEDQITDNDTRIVRVEANNSYIFREAVEENIDYEVSVPYTVEEIDINVVTENTNSVVEVEKIGIEQLSTKERLTVGDNYFKAKVTSSNGNKTQKYNLKVTRIDLPVDTVTLEGKEEEYTGLPIEANTATSLIGSEITYKYYNSVDCSGEEISIPVNPGNYSVKAISSGKENEYHQGSICVTHTILKNTNNNLKSLGIEGYTLNEEFSKDRTSYTVTVEEEAIIKITAEVEGPGATVSGTGTNGVTLGSSKDINITVTSQSGDKKVYTITVTNKRPDSPTVTGGATTWATTRAFILTNPETIHGVSMYEYYVSDTNTKPAVTQPATGLVITPSFSITDSGQYIFFRVITNNNVVGSWSSASNLYVDTSGVRTILQASHNYYNSNKKAATITLPSGNSTLSLSNNTTAGTVYIKADGRVAFQGLNNNKCYVKRFHRTDEEVEKLNNINSSCSKALYKNMVINGYGEYGDNTNFPGFTYNSSSKEFNLIGSSRESIYADNLIPIVTSKKYDYSMEIYSNVTNAYTYLDFMEYDIDKLLVHSTNVMYISNTLTTLARDLKSGDTTVYLTSAANWNMTTTQYFQAGFIFWNYKDSTGYQYPAQSYSKNVYFTRANPTTDMNQFLFNPTKINKTNNTIPLNKAWSGPTYPKGTQISQSSDGGNYNYSLFTGYAPTSYTKYTTQITGINYNNATNDNSSTTSFRPPTKYIKPGMLANYKNASNVTYHIRNIIIEEVD